MKILGVDPGYALTGWGVVEFRGSEPRALGCGVLRTGPEAPMQARLWTILAGARELLEEHRPDCVVVEKLYLKRNTTTAAGVFEARGVVLAAVGGTSARLLEMSPKSVKIAVTGTGGADKRAVGEMVSRILGLLRPPRPDDAADGLACALAGGFWLQGAFLKEEPGRVA